MNTIFALALIPCLYFELLSCKACIKADPIAGMGFLRSMFNCFIWLVVMIYILSSSLNTTT